MNLMKEQKISNRFCPDGMTIEEWQVALRRDFAEKNPFEVEHLDDSRIWGDYLVKNGHNRYRVAFRGVRSDRNYCSCLDFRTNGLGTCKHVEAVALYLKDTVPGYPWGELSYMPDYTSIYVSYKGGRSVKMRVGKEESDRFEVLKNRFFDEEGVLAPSDYKLLPQICNEAKQIAGSFRCYEDVFELTQEYCRNEEWRYSLEEQFPNKSVETTYTEDMPADLKSKIYEMALNGNGVLVGQVSDLIIHEVLALAQIALQEQPNAFGYIVLTDPQRIQLWKGAQANPKLESLALEVMPAGYFVKKLMNNMPPCNFLFVEQAASLREWRNPLSITIKRMQIDHLYLHLETIEDLTPVQFSSVVQHINPFILGPFFRFIRDYRPNFPLSDTGSNLPESVKHFMFIHSIEEMDDLNEALPPIEPERHIGYDTDVEEEVDVFFRQLHKVLSNDALRTAMLYRLRAMLGE